MKGASYIYHLTFNEKYHIVFSARNKCFLEGEKLIYGKKKIKTMYVEINRRKKEILRHVRRQ